MRQTNDTPSRSIGWVWSKSQKQPRPVSPKQLSLSSRWAKTALKVGDTLKSSDGGSVYTVSALRSVYTYEPIKAYGLLGRVLKRWIGDPINVTSLVELSGPRGKLRGLVEQITFR